MVARAHRSNEADLGDAAATRADNAPSRNSAATLGNRYRNDKPRCICPEARP